MAADDDMYLENLKEFVFDEDKIVSGLDYVIVKWNVPWVGARLLSLTFISVWYLLFSVHHTSTTKNMK